MIAHVNVNGHACTRVDLHVPWSGPWWADVVFEAAPNVAGSVQLGIGALELAGTIVQSGVFAAQRRARIVAGGGGWGTLVAARHYANDAGVRPRTVAEDAARLAGEALGDIDASIPSLGVAYVRQAGPASRVLEDVIAGRTWWVDYAGQTQVGARSSLTPRATDYELLGSDPSTGLATMAIDDLTKVELGASISDGLPGTMVVRELVVRVHEESSRVTAWLGETEPNSGRLAELFRDLVSRATDRQLFGKYRYRVYRMSGDRVELQAVSQSAGLPDIIPVAMGPGVAGAHAALTPGSIVLVEFIEGDRSLPLITAFASRGEGGHAPQELDLSVATTLRLGGAGAADAVALAPAVDSQFDDINAALDAFAAATPPLSPPDSGAAIHSAFTAVWGKGVPPKAPSSVGAQKVRAE